MRMNEGSPAAAAFAATELARFPVDAQPTASSLNSRALLIATAVTRSLKERVGELTLSFFKYRLSIPSFLLSRSARTSGVPPVADRKSTRLNSSHGYISYAVFCLKKK